MAGIDGDRQRMLPHQKRQAATYSVTGLRSHVTHRRPAGVAHERTTIVCSDEESACTAIKAVSSTHGRTPAKHVRYVSGRFVPPYSYQVAVYNGALLSGRCKLRISVQEANYCWFSHLPSAHTISRIQKHSRCS